MEESRWRNTILAAMASYLDAGSIVAGAAGLKLWADEFGLSSHTVGLIAAFSSNAISAGVGALVGGWVADRLGRKRVYQWDLLLYAFGVVWIMVAWAPWVLISGYALCGLAVGADVPASWTLIAERAPARWRGRHGGAAQLFWGLGPLVVLVMALALADLGLLGIRLIFGHLLIVSLVLFTLRRRMRESEMWEREHTKGKFARRHVVALLLLIGMYGLWNLKAGTGGFFLPYLLRTVGSQTQAQAVSFQILLGVLAITTTALVFMRLVDRVDQRRLFGIGMALQASSVLVLALFELTVPAVVAFVALSGVSGGFGPQAFFQLWAAESFPTAIRTTALGLMFAVVRIGLGIWSLFVPALADASVQTLAWLLFGFVLVSAGLGLVSRLPRFAVTEISDPASPPAANDRASCLSTTTP